jgi:hypothetical protein
VHGSIAQYAGAVPIVDVGRRMPVGQRLHACNLPPSVLHQSQSWPLPHPHLPLPTMSDNNSGIEDTLAVSTLRTPAADT